MRRYFQISFFARSRSFVRKTRKILVKRYTILIRSVYDDTLFCDPITKNVIIAI